MATLTNIQAKSLESLFPVYGEAPRREIMPIWNDGDKMFITTHYQSKAGHYYYMGLRFSSQIAIVEKVSLWNTWKYIDSVEVYKFNGRERELIGSKKFEKTFYNADVIKSASQTIVENFMVSQMKMSNQAVNETVVADTAERMIGECYKSFLDNDYAITLGHLKPLLQIEAR